MTKLEGYQDCKHFYQFSFSLSLKCLCAATAHIHYIFYEDLDCPIFLDPEGFSGAAMCSADTRNCFLTNLNTSGFDKTLKSQAEMRVCYC